MSFFKYLRDQHLTIIFFAACLALTDFMLWLQPKEVMPWHDLLYLNLLLGLFFCGFLVATYWHQRQWYLQINSRYQAKAAGLNWRLEQPQTFAQQQVVTYVNQLLDYHQQSLAQLLRQNQDQKEFIASWVHDIKVPLAALQMLNESYQDRLPEKINFQMTDELTRIDHYVEQVLYYSRLDAFSKDYLIQEHALKTIINQVVRDNATYFLHKKIHFQLNGKNLTVLTDEKWLYFILNQIIANSLKYTAPNGHITVNLSQTEQGVKLTITDDGIGIAPQDLKRIFDKGFTGNNGRQKAVKATGLGLYLAKQLSEKLGHQLTAQSTINQGTTLTLLFPFLSYYNDEFNRLLR